jgi:hypothetical protein
MINLPSAMLRRNIHLGGIGQMMAAQFRQPGHLV